MVEVKVAASALLKLLPFFWLLIFVHKPTSMSHCHIAMCLEIRLSNLGRTG